MEKKIFEIQYCKDVNIILTDGFLSNSLHNNKNDKSYSVILIFKLPGHLVSFDLKKSAKVDAHNQRQFGQWFL
jgi:hypothetical protein